MRIDKAANNSKWQDAIAKEVGALVQHQCFVFKSPDYKAPKDFQYVRLNLVFDIKNDLCYKARLVCDGQRVDPKGLATRATVVKTIMVRLIDIIAHS